MLIIGHRGARREAPENTLAGFHHLQELGIRAVEFDIQVSADGELVVLHDPELERTTSGQGLVGTHSAEALSRLDACHSAFPDWPSAEGVPRLSEVLALLGDFTHIELEVKAKSEADEAVVIARLPALWAKFKLAGRARTTSFNTRYLRGIEQAAPDISRGLLCNEYFMGDAIETALGLGATSLGPHYTRCSEALIHAAHSAGLVVTTWTVNDEATANHLAAAGVDGIITDIPTQALHWFSPQAA